MNKSLLATLVAAVLLSTAPVSAPVEATSAIQRCASPDGTLVYTDRGCAAFSAKAVPIPGDLITRIAHEESMSQSAGGAGEYADAATPFDASDTSIALSRRSPNGGCAHSPTQLAMDLRGALGLGDVNRVAESYDWAGMSNRQGQQTLDRLQQLLGKPVIESRYYNAKITSSPFSGEGDGAMTATADNSNPAGDAGILQLALGNGAHASVIDFAVQHYAGCYFIRF